MIKKSILLGSILSSLFAITGCQSLGSDITVTETLSYKNVEEITIDVSSAEVDIIKANRKDIYVEFDTYKNGDTLRTEEGKKTTIETYNRKKISVFTNTNYKLRVFVPEDYNGDMIFNMSSGSISLSDFDLGDVAFDFSSGSLNISDITAKQIDLDLSSGDVNFSNVSTPLLNIEMSSGDVDLDDFTGKIKGDSSSGSFTVSYKEVMDDLEFEASSGSITIDYRNVDIDGDFNLSKSSGDIDIDLELNNYKESNDGDKITGTIGSGEYKIELNISSGKIRIK